MKIGDGEKKDVKEMCRKWESEVALWKCWVHHEQTCVHSFVCVLTHFFYFASGWVYIIIC